MPAEFYQPSPRSMPARLPPLEYPDRYEVRYVSANGGKIDDGIWNVYFGALKLGRLLERTMKIEDAYGRLYRHHRHHRHR